MAKSPARRNAAELQKSRAYAQGRPTYTPWRRHFVWPWKPIRLISRNAAGQKTESVTYIGYVWARIAMMPQPHLQFSRENPEKQAPKAILKQR